MEAYHKVEWDFRGWSKHSNFVYVQKDWNQTLAIRINQVSAEIHMSTLYGPADLIKMHPMMFAIVKSLEYTRLSKDGVTLGGRYKIIIDEKLPSDKIYVLREGEPIKDEDRDELKTINPLMLIGEITVTNHHTIEVDPVTNETRLRVIYKPEIVGHATQIVEMRNRLNENNINNNPNNNE